MPRTSVTASSSWTDRLDPHLVSMLESKIEKTRFVRVDSDIAERLIVKSDSKEAGLSPEQTDMMSTLFRTQIPEIEKTNFIVTFAQAQRRGLSGHHHAE